ncbi:MAG: DUF2284 domain-containing protein [Ruminococcaceae bacterium]|nr:DUF2284 domain-containing protein [Oscillospiraceae bacterium]
MSTPPTLPAQRTRQWPFVSNMEKYFSHPDIFECKVIPANDIPFEQSVADACKSNQCGKYGTCWTCPPGAGQFQELEKKIKTYETAVVFTCKYDLEDPFDFEGMIDGQQKTMQVLRDIMDALQADGKKFLALGCEGCNLCKKCTYPDAPCRYPEKAVVSVEACGIHVVNLSKNIGIKYNNGVNTVTYFCVVLFSEAL